MTYNDIAKALRISPTRVKQLCDGALEQLAEQFTEDEIKEMLWELENSQPTMHDMFEEKMLYSMPGQANPLGDFWKEKNNYATNF